MERKLLRKPTVLAVDDQPANLVTLDAVLGAECNMILAGSGMEAISLLTRRQDVDVILMDLQMPGMDGFEAASRIKQIEGCADIPVVFVTAVYNEDPFIKQGYKVGGVDYFSKPFDPEILRVKVGIYASFRQQGEILKERERQLKHSRELQQVGREIAAMLKGLRVGVIVVDAEGKVRRTNENLLRICGSEDVSSVQLGWWDAAGVLRPGLFESLTRALATGKTLDNELMDVACPDGTVRTIVCSASPLRALDGRIEGAVFVVHDFTEHGRIERELERRIATMASAGAEAAAA